MWCAYGYKSTVSYYIAYSEALLTSETKKPNRSSLLSYVAGWNKVGLHLKLLKELLTLGYDCSADMSCHSQVPLKGFFSSSSRAAVQPPLSMSNEEYGEPFLLQFLTECSKNGYGESESDATRRHDGFV
jgi:hypothetical protein